jgi:hypothetical protein
MKFLSVVLLVCLFLAGPASAAVGNLQLAVTPNLQVMPNVFCSQDTYPPFPDQTVIWVVYLAGFGDTFINGDPKMPVTGLSSGGKPGFQYYVSAGTYTVDITRDGYSPFRATVQTCQGKVSYVYYDLTKQVITKAPTTTVTTTMTTVPTTTVTQVQGGVTQPAQQQATTQATAAVTAAVQQDTLGSLSVKTEPAGAFIFIDGVQRGVTPATIPGIPAGTHTLLLKLDGYQDISTPVTIAAGKTQEYSSAMAKVSATAAAAPADTTVTPKKSPGFAFLIALAGLGAVLCLRKGRSG